MQACPTEHVREGAVRLHSRPFRSNSLDHVLCSTLPGVTTFSRHASLHLRAPPMLEGGGELQGQGTPARPLRCGVLARAALKTRQAPPSPAIGGWGSVPIRLPQAPLGTYLGRPQCSTSAPIAHQGKKQDRVRLQ